jgi:hypothetical protein
MPEQSLPLLLKKKDAAFHLSCTTKHIEALVKQGKLIEIRLGERTPRITRKSLLELLAGK